MPLDLLMTFLLGKTSFYGLFCLLRGFVGLVGLFLLGLSCLGEATVEQIEELEEFH